MELNQMNCCAFNEIDYLEGYQGKPEWAMAHFVGQCNEEEYENGVMKDNYRFGAFYIFTAMVKDREKGTTGTYGHEFAAYIRAHNLGRVIETPQKLNRKNEPDHWVKGWIWMPNVRNLKAWMKANGVNTNAH